MYVYIRIYIYISRTPSALILDVKDRRKWHALASARSAWRQVRSARAMGLRTVSFELVVSCNYSPLSANYELLRVQWPVVLRNLALQ